MKTLWMKTLRDLWRSRAQALALGVVSMLGVASMLALSGAYRNLSSSYQATYERLNFADLTFSVQATRPQILREIGALEGVANVTGRLIVDTGLERPDGRLIQGRLIGLPDDQRPAVNDLLVLEGGYFSGDHQGLAALIESHFANEFDLGPGSRVRVFLSGREYSVPIDGVAASPEYLIVSPSRQRVLASARSFGVLFVPLSDLQAELGLPDQINDVAVDLAPGVDAPRVQAQIERILEGDGLLMSTPREEQASHAALKLDLEGYREIAYAMPGLILLTAGFAIYMLLGRMVRSQEPQIGLMKALGYPTWMIAIHYLSFALAVALLGALGGTAIGPWLSRAITEGYAAELGIPLVSVHSYPDLLAIALALTLTMAALAAWLPARRAARIAPVEAMRSSPPTSLTAPLRAWRTLPLPLTARLAMRNIVRSPRRTVTTFLGIIFAYILVLMAWGMIDSMDYLVETEFSTIETWDLMVTLQSPTRPGALRSELGVQGVLEVEPFFISPGSIKIGSRTQGVILQAIDFSHSLHRPLVIEGQRDLSSLDADSAILVASLADSLDLAPGDRFRLETPFGDSDFVYRTGVQELYTSSVYIPFEGLSRLTDSSAPLANGTRILAVESQINDLPRRFYRLPQVRQVLLHQDLQQDWTSLLGLFYLFMGVIMAFAITMAAALLFNTMMINVFERERELATMRSIGARPGRIAAMLNIETVILWLLTILPGFLIGYLVTVQMGAAFSSDLLSFTVYIAPRSYLLTGLAILVTMILAAQPAIRRVNRLNLAEATKLIS